MGKATMTFRVESDLRESFNAATERSHVPAAQVLREFMRSYVKQSRERIHSLSEDPITSAESQRRQAAVNFARSSVGLEGFTPSKAAEMDAHQFIKGDIKLADFVQVKPDEEQARSR